MPPKHFEPVVRMNGTVMDIFVHRFILQTAEGKCLVDLTPHGAEAVVLKQGDEILIEGEQKPSEIKVLKLERSGHTYVIAHKHEKPAHHHPKGHHSDHLDVDPTIAMTAVKSAGYKIVGEPRRKPKHFEVLGKKGRSYQELHVELDGNIYKEKQISADDHKWQAEIESARLS